MLPISTCVSQVLDLTKSCCCRYQSPSIQPLTKRNEGSGARMTGRANLFFLFLSVASRVENSPKGSHQRRKKNILNDENIHNSKPKKNLILVLCFCLRQVRFDNTVYACTCARAQNPLISKKFGSILEQICNTPHSAESPFFR